MQDRNRRQSVVAGRHVPSGGLVRVPGTATGGLALPHHPETGPQCQRLDVRTLCLVHELVDLLVNQPGMERGAARRGQVDQAFEKRLIGRDAKDRGLVERAPQPVERLVAGFGPGDQLGEHGIVIGRDDRSALDAGLDANAVGRKLNISEHPRSTAESCSAGSSAHSRASTAWPRHRTSRWANGNPSPAAIRSIGLDDIDAGHHFGDGVLDLKARIDLQEIVAVGAEDEFDRADPAIVQALAEPHRVGDHSVAQRRGKIGGRGFLDQLLVAPLQRTFALEQMDHIAVAVAGDLDFDMPPALDQFFDDQPGIAEGVFRLAHRGFDFAGKTVQPGHGTHALAAASGRGLQHHRKPEIAQRCRRFRRRLRLPSCCRGRSGRRPPRPRAWPTPCRRAAR